MSGTSTTVATAGSSLIERDDQLAALARAVDGVRAGTSSVVLISGGLGAGRSALLHALTDAAEQAGVRWRAARATRSEQSLPFGVAHRLRDTDRAGPHRDGTVRSGPQEPLVVVVDDLQWADDLSLAWLCRLCHSSAHAPVLLAFAVLDGDPQSERPAVRDLCHRAGRTLRAAPLSAGAARQLIHQHAGATAGARAADRWPAASAGNPMLLGALLADGCPDGAEPILPATSPLWHRIGATIAVDGDAFGQPDDDHGPAEELGPLAHRG